MAKPFISLFRVSPKTINKGEEVVFVWGVANSTTRHLTDKGGILPVGSWRTKPASTKTYTLTAGNPEGTSKKFQTVTVIQPPAPPPPTPPPETFTLTVHTIPVRCHIEVDNRWVTNSGDDGISVFINLAKGSHSVEVSKGELTTRTVTVDITKDTEITINISKAPDFWTSPVEWIQYFVITTMDTLLGWMGGSFVTLLQDAKSFFDTSWTQIGDFFADVPGAIVKAVQDNLHNILVWQSVQLINFFEWITTLTSTNFEALKAFLGDIGDFVGTAFTDFVDWLLTLGGTVADYISSQVEGFLTWGEGLLTDIWEGTQGWVMDLIIGLIDSFEKGFDQGIEDQKNLRRR